MEQVEKYLNTKFFMDSFIFRGKQHIHQLATYRYAMLEQFEKHGIRFYSLKVWKDLWIGNQNRNENRKK